MIKSKRPKSEQSDRLLANQYNLDKLFISHFLELKLDVTNFLENSSQATMPNAES